MSTRRTRPQPSLMDILRPRAFRANAKRAAVTRTIVQPEVDKFEAMVEATPGHVATPSRLAVAIE